MSHSPSSIVSREVEKLNSMRLKAHSWMVSNSLINFLKYIIFRSRGLFRRRLTRYLIYTIEIFSLSYLINLNNFNIALVYIGILYIFFSIAHLCIFNLRSYSLNNYNLKPKLVIFMNMALIILPLIYFFGYQYQIFNLLLSNYIIILLVAFFTIEFAFSFYSMVRFANIQFFRRIYFPPMYNQIAVIAAATFAYLGFIINSVYFVLICLFLIRISHQILYFLVCTKYENGLDETKDYPSIKPFRSFFDLLAIASFVVLSIFYLAWLIDLNIKIYNIVSIIVILIFCYQRPYKAIMVDIYKFINSNNKLMVAKLIKSADKLVCLIILLSIICLCIIKFVYDLLSILDIIFIVLLSINYACLIRQAILGLNLKARNIYIFYNLILSGFCFIFLYNYYELVLMVLILIQLMISISLLYNFKISFFPSPNKISKFNRYYLIKLTLGGSSFSNILYFKREFSRVYNINAFDVYIYDKFRIILLINDENFKFNEKEMFIDLSHTVESIHNVTEQYLESQTRNPIITIKKIHDHLVDNINKIGLDYKIWHYYSDLNILLSDSKDLDVYYVSKAIERYYQSKSFYKHLVRLKDRPKSYYYVIAHLSNVIFVIESSTKSAQLNALVKRYSSLFSSLDLSSNKQICFQEVTRDQNSTDFNDAA